MCYLLTMTVLLTILLAIVAFFACLWLAGWAIALFVLASAHIAAGLQGLRPMLRALWLAQRDRWRRH